MLIGLFLSWQCFQVFDVLKNNITQRRSFGAFFYLDVIILLAGAYAVYVSLDWLVAWLAAQKDTPFGPQSLGWLSGWLMVLPNAILAFFYAARRRADIVYASQVGDGHICIPLRLGLGALVQPLPVPPIFPLGLGIVIGALVVHGLAIITAGELPRWLGWPLLAGYAWFVGTGLFALTWAVTRPPADRREIFRRVQNNPACALSQPVSARISSIVFCVWLHTG
ncbi:MAG: hypothetical protein H7343_09640 [Undibacterium sp.]|nr:hypothetical protein [Opitutaceae bacterium]